MKQDFEYILGYLDNNLQLYDSHGGYYVLFRLKKLPCYRIICPDLYTNHRSIYNTLLRVYGISK